MCALDCPGEGGAKNGRLSVARGGTNFDQAPQVLSN